MFLFSSNCHDHNTMQQAAAWVNCNLTLTLFDHLKYKHRSCMFIKTNNQLFESNCKGTQAISQCYAVKCQCHLFKIRFALTKHLPFDSDFNHSSKTFFFTSFLFSSTPWPKRAATQQLTKEEKIPLRQLAFSQVRRLLITKTKLKFQWFSLLVT